jgi:predicted XRE-type DNA-binding protein
MRACLNIFASFYFHRWKMPKKVIIPDPEKGGKPITLWEVEVMKLIWKIRKEKGYKQQQVADLLGVTRSYVGNIENSLQRARYTLDHINILAFYWDISPRLLIPGESIDPKNPGE